MRAPLVFLGTLAAIASTVAGSACKDRSLPPLPESFVIVDTNVAVPGGVSRLRVDLYAADGLWFDSRDVALPDPRDWPASFGVYSDDESRARTVWVRLRAYPDGRLRDYRGERTIAWSAPFAVPTGDEQPRLLRDGVDVTPALEPDPLLTIDRLVRVRLRPGVRATTDVLLHGACFGTMPSVADLASGVAESCVDEAKARGVVSELPERGDAVVGPTQAGTWLSSPCGTAANADRVCVAGGATIIGAADQLDVPAGGPNKPSVPVRTFGVSSFWMDRTEVTVAQVRAALAGGFAAAAPLANDGPLRVPTAFDDIKGCTYSKSPLGREGYGVTCWTKAQARAFCQHAGGDLPTEVQWEHAAATAQRPRKTRYPWGNEEASCARAATSRAIMGGSSPCEKEAIGPDDVMAHPDDVTPFGALGLAGGISEWVRDAYADYESACWASASIVDPSCMTGGGVAWRGAAWVSPLVWSTYRLGITTDAALMFVGFRCVYEVAP